MRKMPNFLIIGANKAGTTALASYLSQHPSIYMSPVKEPMFFSFVGLGTGDHISIGAPGAKRPQSIPVVATLEKYQRLFEGTTRETAAGEASTSYLSDPQTPGMIRRYLPDAKLIAILRHPADRAFSNYLMYRMWGFETVRSFRRVIDLEEWRIQQGYPPGWGYLRLGRYFDGLMRYFDLFDRSQLRIYLYEDWDSRPLDIIRDVFRFLDVDDSFVPDMTQRHNVTQVHRSRLVDVLINRHTPLTDAIRHLAPAPARRHVGRFIRDWNRPRLSTRDRRYLIDLCREDILKLQDLLGRDLSHWLTP
jgi:hypothetical protein